MINLKNAAPANLGRVFMFITITTSRKVVERFTGSLLWCEALSSSFSPGQRAAERWRPSGHPNTVPKFKAGLPLINRSSPRSEIYTYIYVSTQNSQNN